MTVIETVVVASEPPVAEDPPTVTVVVVWASRLLAWFSAFRIADSGIGAPAISHTICNGVRRRSSSRSQLPCMHVMRSGRKFPAEARQRQATSVTEQLSSWDWSIQSWIHCGREETNPVCTRGIVIAERSSNVLPGIESILIVEAEWASSSLN